MTHPLTAQIIARRVKVGADTPEGKHLSLLDGQLRNSAPVDLINQTIAGIDQIQRDGGLYVHSNHGAGR